MTGLLRGQHAAVVFARVQVADLVLNLRVDAVAGELRGHADGVLHGLGVRSPVRDDASRLSKVRSRSMSHNASEISMALR